MSGPTPWECPGCGMTATVNLDALGALGVVRCTCGTNSRVIPSSESASQDTPPEGLPSQ